MFFVKCKVVVAYLFVIGGVLVAPVANANIFMNSLQQSIYVCASGPGSSSGSGTQSSGTGNNDNCAYVDSGSCVGSTSEATTYTVQFRMDGTTSHLVKTPPTGTTLADLKGEANSKVLVTSQFYVGTHDFGVVLETATAVNLQINNALLQSNCSGDTYTGL